MKKKICLGSAIALVTVGSAVSCGPTGVDLELTDITGNYNPITLSDSLTLTADFTSDIISTTDSNGVTTTSNWLAGSVPASTLTSLDPTTGQSWNTISVSYAAPALTITQNPGTSGATVYTIDQSGVTGSGTPVDTLSMSIQLGQTMSTEVSNGCEVVSSEELDFSFKIDSFQAQVIDHSILNNIAASPNNSPVTCGQLLTQVASELSSGTADPSIQLYSIFVANDIITIDQVQSLSELSIAASFGGPKVVPAPVASSTPAAGSGSAGQTKTQSVELSSLASKPAFALPDGDIMSMRMPSMLKVFHNGVVQGLIGKDQR